MEPQSKNITDRPMAQAMQDTGSTGRGPISAPNQPSGMSSQKGLPQALSSKPSNNIPTITLDGDNDDAPDSLDEEWVQKAKVIVEQTRLDPFQQSNKLSRMKADYLKKHYNKDIKIAEDQLQ
ncbi:MAG TPA: hypothetical protein VGS08_03570 [Candidatus Saccharimonadales bacterium]|nr:hypothetical protein [Candidatus Saccharimonadales bacterium]